MSKESKINLLLLFVRPTEPCFMPKGGSVFQLPESYYTDEYKSMSKEISDSFATDNIKKVVIKKVALPNLSIPLELPFDEQFSLFVPKHREMSGNLIDIFMGMKNVDDLLSIACYCQMRINPEMFNYCLSVAMLHRKDTKNMRLPLHVHSFPDKFIDPKVFQKAMEMAAIIPESRRTPIVIPPNFTASSSEPEQRVAYLREDIGVNLHHWHWHLVYPFSAKDTAIVNKDRRGELFYYMHQQIIARYNAERLCNNLEQVIGFSNYRTPIAEGYFPKLNSKVASRDWPPRFVNVAISDIDRSEGKLKLKVSQLEEWRDRFVEAIDKGAILLPNNTTIPLDEETGIDMLGNLMESSIISRNREYFGDLHNMGHVMISVCHDPVYRFLEPAAVMFDEATAMRDPVFYRWHSHLNDLFNHYKKKLTPYTPERLVFPGINVQSISIDGSNRFTTFWEQTTMEVTHGMDFKGKGSIQVTFTHLQHDEFNYVIEVNNTSGQLAMGMFRIFMAPTADEKGQKLSFAEQRRWMIELDKFSHPLTVGNNTVRRTSVDSSVTIPLDRIVQHQEEGSDFCGCGWPHHMLVPKGTTQGYPVVLFCMVSNWQDDRVDQDTVGSCNAAASYCGVKDRLYPDRRAMGYPFDRAAVAATLSDFLTPNMVVRECVITFTDTVKQKPHKK